MNRTLLGSVVALFTTLASPVASAQPFNSAPWLEDLEQARQAFHSKYANWDWATNEREINIDALFDESAGRLRMATNDQQARAIFDRIAAKLGDGHVEFEWKDPPGQTGIVSTPHAYDLCNELGYDARQNGRGTAQALDGYVPLAPADAPLAAGLVNSNGTKVGVLRIGVFQPQGYPELCRAAATALSIPQDKPCDEKCEDRITNWAYDRLTATVERRINQLRNAGATVLLLDITNNGGGSEWDEAVARILSPKLLVSGRRGFVRGEHWARQWQNLATKLRAFAQKADSEDRKRLLDWAKQADAAQTEASSSCVATKGACKRIATAGFATGLVGAARAGEYAGKEWGVEVFSPAQYPYHDGVWSGPLIVLVDQETWSAAEELTAVLQDNKAAVVMGARTGGAGCGRSNGGTPTTLRNSLGVLLVPDCVRFRSDGSNEVRGIIPDQLVPFRREDGERLRGEFLAKALPRAIREAQQLQH